MRIREKLNMDTETAFNQGNRRKRIFLTVGVLLAIYILSLVATALLVHNLYTCPEESNLKLCESLQHSNSLGNTKQLTHSDKTNSTVQDVNTKDLNKIPLVEDESTTTTSTTSTTITTTTSTTPAPIPTTELPDSDTSLNVRLPRSVKPISYQIQLIPYLIEKNFSFDGNISILVQVVDENVKNITLHAAALEIDENAIKVFPVDDIRTRNVGASIVTQNFTSDEKRQFFIIHFDNNLINNHYYLINISYTGILNNHLQGLYKSSYMSGNQTKWLAVSQFQPTDARRAFPCFDEPDMKANFTLKIARLKNHSSLSNMPKIGKPEPVHGSPDYVWDSYQESVPMSTYLVALAVTDFSSKTSGNFTVWARSDVINSANFALEIGPKILKFLENFFDIEFPLPKIDMIALPDFSAGAMENWGLITFRETSMLYDESMSGQIVKQRIASVVSHELAHQWFGNLVTPSWWTDLWLNEGFASYMEYVCVDVLEPSWKLMEQFVLNDLQNVFVLDAMSSSHPISIKVNNPDEINEIFDRISYAKGASIIRMMDHFLTTEVFKRGLSNYLREMAYESAEQDDLWKFLTNAARDANIFDNTTSVKEIMDTWTLQTGFPIVHVHRNYSDNSVTFKQERFVLNKATQNDTKYDEDDGPVWWIPLSYTSSKELDFRNTRPSSWMSGEKEIIISDINIANNDWILVNLQQTGYYRVNYDEQNWSMITRYLRNAETFKNITAINRAQLIDDALNFASSGYIDYKIALNMTRYLKHETDSIPWRAAINSLNYIDSMLVKGGEYHKFKMYMLKLIEKAYISVGFEENKSSDILTNSKRVDILTAACHYGYKDCIIQSIQKYHMWMNQPDPNTMNPISPNLKSIIYCTAIKYGDEAEWDFAWDRYHATTNPTEKELILVALGCTREYWILTRYLERAMAPEYGIRKHDVVRVFASISNYVIGQPIAINYIFNNFELIREYLGQSVTTLNMIVKFSTRRLNTRFELEELKRFIDHHLKDGKRLVQQSIERAEANINWMDRNYKTINQWLDDVIDSTS